MSLYNQAVATAIALPPKGYARKRLTATLVKVHTVIPTPHGPVTVGEAVIGEYFPPGAMPPAEIGRFSLKTLGRGLKKAGRGVGRGIGKAAKKTGRLAKKTGKLGLRAGKLALKYHPAVLAAKGGFKIAKFTGKHVAKGSKKALRWARKNPLKVAAIATGPLGLATFATFHGAKAVAHALAPSKRGGNAVPALSAVPSDSDRPSPSSNTRRWGGVDPAGVPRGEVPGASFYSPEGAADAATLDADDDAARMAEPESYPGEQNDDGNEANDETNESPDVLSGDPDDEGAPDEGDDSDADDSDDGADDDSDESEVSGMADEEWVGLEEIAGDDDGVGDEWVGADEIAGSARRRPVARRLAPMPNAALVRKKGYSKKRRQPLAFNSSGTVAAGASATIAVVSQTLFRGRKLIVPAAIMASFTIDDLKVGNVSQFAASGSQAGEAFGPTTTGEDNIQMDTCPPGLSIYLTVTNTSGGALQFRATLFGDSIQ